MKKEGSRLDIIKHNSSRLDSWIILGSRLDICCYIYKVISNSPYYLDLFQYYYPFHLYPLLEPPNLVDIIVF